MSKRILEHISRNFEHVREGVGTIMGGKVLDYEAKTILNAGKAMSYQETILEVLAKLGSVSDLLRNRIEEQKDLEVLKNWFSMSIRAKNLEEFIENM